MRFWKIFLFIFLPGAVILTALIFIFSPAARIKALQNFALLYPKLRGIRNNNPGNLRAGTGYTWDGQTGTDSKNFAVFDTPDNGIRALGITLLHKQTKDGITDLRSLGLSYAPPDDNAGDITYGSRLADQLGVNQDDQYDLLQGQPFTLASLEKAVVKNEQGINPYPDDMFFTEQAVALEKVMSEENLA